jgi:hypothetical protein
MLQERKGFQEANLETLSTKLNDHQKLADDERFGCSAEKINARLVIESQKFGLWPAKMSINGFQFWKESG